MIRLKARLLAVLAVFSLVFANSAFADENALVALKNQMAASEKAKSKEVAGLTSQVNDLNKKISMLESKLSSVEGKVGSSTPAYVQAGAPADTSNLHGIEVHGFIDTQYANNFRQPKGNANSVRIFDTTSSTFSVNAAEINIEKAALEPGQAGFRVDVMFGDDANVVNASGSDATSKVDLQQAYVEYIAPLSFLEGSSVLPDSINIKAGRFVTLAGLEVIEAPDNWNISRSFMFGLGIPFTHTGVRTNFGLFNDFFDVYLGLNNGWDQARDTNKFRTFESAIGWTLMDTVNFFHALYWGAETASASSGQKRTLITNTATVDVTDKLSLMAESNWGHQNGMTGGTVVANNQDNADWWGFAGYAKYQFTDKFAISSRTEIFGDNSLFRTGGLTGGGDERLMGQTFTAEYKLTDQLITRGEIRLDRSNSTDAIDGKAHQTTVGAQMIYVV